MIFVQFRKEGIHLYPAAKDDPKLATGDKYDVSFLGYAHRHTFHFKVHIEVFHDDRDIEFIQFKRWLEELYDEKTLELNHKSCEMISDDLYAQITERYPNRDIWIEVSEDGETAYKTEIQIGSQNTEYYEVISGLKPGDKIITSSYENYGDKNELILN